MAGLVLKGRNQAHSIKFNPLKNFTKCPIHARNQRPTEPKGIEHLLPSRRYPNSTSKITAHRDIPNEKNHAISPRNLGHLASETPGSAPKPSPISPRGTPTYDVVVLVDELGGALNAHECKIVVHGVARFQAGPHQARHSPARAAARPDSSMPRARTFALSLCYTPAPHPPKHRTTGAPTHSAIHLILSSFFLLELPGIFHSSTRRDELWKRVVALYIVG